MTRTGFHRGSSGNGLGGVLWWIPWMLLTMSKTLAYAALLIAAAATTVIAITVIRP